MSNEYAGRYGREFIAIANGAKATRQKTTNQPRPPFRVLYSGAMAEDMNLHSIRDVARTVAELSSEFPTKFEIRTMPWFKRAARPLSDFKAVYARNLALRWTYRRSLRYADCLLIAYNFDAKSIRYTRLSMANKLPESLASGSPILGYGPSEVATIAKLEELNAALVVNKRDTELLRSALVDIMRDVELRTRITGAALHAASSHFDPADIRKKFSCMMVQAKEGNPSLGLME